MSRSLLFFRRPWGCCRYVVRRILFTNDNWQKNEGNLMGLLLLILSTTAIVFLDKKIYGTFYTPSIILSVPFLVICILYDLNADLLGFTALNYDVLYIW